jgi:hypothetical protein
VLLTGIKGSNKTRLHLTMMRRGWDYLADDKLILHGGRAYVFQTSLLLKDEHLAGMPWLDSALPAARRLKRGRGIRRRLAAWAARLLPGYLLPVIKRLHTHAFRVEVTRVFPDRRVVSAEMPTAVAVVSRGRRLSSRLIPRNEAIAELVAVQDLHFHTTAPLDRLLAFRRRARRPDTARIVEHNLADSRFLRLTIPDACDMEIVYEELTRCLAQPS